MEMRRMIKRNEEREKCEEAEQNQMQRAMTGQKNLNADTDRARSFNRGCKVDWYIQQKESGVLTRCRQRRNINSSTTPGGGRCSVEARSTGMMPHDGIGI
jgi:hypothetical protein